MTDQPNLADFTPDRSVSTQEIVAEFRRIRSAGSAQMSIALRVAVAEYVKECRAAGIKWDAIAQEFGVTPQALRRIKNHPLRAGRKARPYVHWTELAPRLLNYDPETGVIRCIEGYRKGWIAASTRKSRASTYVMCNFERHRLLAHNVAWFLHYGVEVPKGVRVDHIDRNGTNNRIANLRLADVSQNAWNAPVKALAHRSSKYKGVSRCKRDRKWRASIRVRGVIFRQRCESEEDAARAYDALAIKHAGEFACTNQSLGLLEQAESNGCSARPEILVVA